jgi:hypothetical protein
VGQVHNALERAGSITSALKDALGATDGEGGLERYGETLTPIIDLWRQPEWYFLRDEKLFASTSTVAAVAAEFAAVALVNPAGSKCLVVIDKISYNAAPVGLLKRITQTAAEATLTVQAKGVPRDSRIIPVTPVANLQLGSDPAETIGNGDLESRTSSAGESVNYECVPLILPPGTGVCLMLRTVNIGVVVNYSWRERFPFPAELG